MVHIHANSHEISIKTELSTSLYDTMQINQHKLQKTQINPWNHNSKTRSNQKHRKPSRSTTTAIISHASDTIQEKTQQIYIKKHQQLAHQKIHHLYSPLHTNNHDLQPKKPRKAHKKRPRKPKSNQWNQKWRTVPETEADLAASKERKGDRGGEKEKYETLETGEFIERETKATFPLLSKARYLKHLLLLLLLFEEGINERRFQRIKAAKKTVIPAQQTRGESRLVDRSGAQDGEEDRTLTFSRGENVMDFDVLIGRWRLVGGGSDGGEGCVNEDRVDRTRLCECVKPVKE